MVASCGRRCVRHVFSTFPPCEFLAINTDQYYFLLLHTAVVVMTININIRYQVSSWIELSGALGTHVKNPNALIFPSGVVLPAHHGTLLRYCTALISIVLRLHAVKRGFVACIMAGYL